MSSSHSNDCQHDEVLPEVDVSAAQLDSAAAMFAALSDPSRLRLLLLLAPGERCVSELVQLENAKVSSISARLKLLHAARLVSRRREAKHIYYALADEHVHALLTNVLGHAAESFTDH